MKSLQKSFFGSSSFATVSFAVDSLATGAALEVAVELVGGGVEVKVGTAGSGASVEEVEVSVHSATKVAPLTSSWARSGRRARKQLGNNGRVG